MARALRSAKWERAQVILTGTFVTVVVVGVLYWAQSVIMPVALAIFFTFLLSPVVTTLQRWHLGRVPAAILTTVLALGIVLAVAALTVSQVSSLVVELPSYSDVIKKKVQWVQSETSGETWTRLGGMLRGNNLPGTQSSPPPSEDADGKTQAEKVARTPIVVPEGDPLWARLLPSLFRPTLETLGQLGLTVVLLLFMLLKREDLRNRFIRLVGHGRMTLTTKAVDDASQRISRFLFMQFVINACYAVAVTIGLLAIGVKYPLLWGFLAGAMRYIPYIGAPLTALFPLTLSLVQFEGWWHASLVLSLFVVLEVVTSNFVEPRLYGQSIGVSEVALLIAAALWGFLWGAVGLILSCPLTVCLVVLGKYVPQLEFLAVLLGDEPALSEDVTYYQRLAAKDQDEASQIALAAADNRPAEEVYDALLLPALNHTLRDRQRDLLDEEDERFIFQSTQEIIEEVAEKQEKQAKAAQASEKKVVLQEATESPLPSKKVRILGVPARDPADALALEMLAHILDQAKWELQISSIDELTAELVGRIEEKQPALICIASLQPGSLTHTRYLCKRLRAHFPKLQVIVGRWSLHGETKESLEGILEGGATSVETTLIATRNHLNSWLPALLAKEAESRHDDCNNEPLNSGARPDGKTNGDRFSQAPVKAH